MNKGVLQKIADETGLSVRTIRRVLNNGNKQVWASTEHRGELIRAAAARHNYRPNGAASAMSTGRFNAIALLLSTHRERSTLPPRLLDGITAFLSPANLHLTIAQLPDENLTNAGHVPRLLKQWLSDGLLINYTDHIPAKMIELIRTFEVPSVWINSIQDDPCVYPDDEQAGRDLTAYLIQMGHRNIAFVDYAHRSETQHASHFSVAARRRGYEQAMAAAKLAPSLQLRWTPYAERLLVSQQWLLRAEGRPTAVICYGDQDAVAIVTAAFSLGLQVPRDLSIATFADEKLVSPGFVVTTMLVPQYRMGFRAAEWVMQRVEAGQSKHSGAPREAIPFELVPGVSSVPPRSRHR